MRMTQLIFDSFHVPLMLFLRLMPLCYPNKQRWCDSNKYKITEETVKALLVLPTSLEKLGWWAWLHFPCCSCFPNTNFPFYHVNHSDSTTDEWTTTCIWDDTGRTTEMGGRQIKQVRLSFQSFLVSCSFNSFLFQVLMGATVFNLIHSCLLPDCSSHKWLLFCLFSRFSQGSQLHGVKGKLSLFCNQIIWKEWGSDCRFLLYPFPFIVVFRLILLLFSWWSIRLSLKYTPCFRCCNWITLMSRPSENSWESLPWKT